MLWVTRLPVSFISNIVSGHVANIFPATEKKKKLTSSEMRKKKKDRMARRKRGEEVFSDEDD